MLANSSVNNFIKKHKAACILTGGTAIVGFLGYRAIKKPHQNDEKTIQVADEHIIDKTGQRSNAENEFYTKEFSQCSQSLIDPIKFSEQSESIISSPQEKKVDIVNRIMKTHVFRDSSSSIENIRVYFLGEDHTSDNDREANAQFINENYQEGDLVLLEGFSGEPASEEDKKIQLDYFKLLPKINIYGWDNINKDLQTQIDNIFFMGPLLSELMNMVNNFKDTNDANSGVIFKESFQQIINTMHNAIDKFPISNFSSLEDALNLYRKLEVDRELGDETSKDFKISTCKYMICNFVKLNSVRLSLKLSKITNGQSFVERNTAMIDAIMTKLKEAKVIYVIGGKAHFDLEATYNPKEKEGVAILREALRSNQIAWALLFPKNLSSDFPTKTFVKENVNNNSETKSLHDVLNLLIGTLELSAGYKK